MAFRIATAADVPAITRLVNFAYRVEDFFKIGERTDESDVLAHLATGRYIAFDGPAGQLAGCVYVELRGLAGYFGMLAVDPDAQRKGLGRELVRQAEREARAAGSVAMELDVVDLRTELVPWYERLGYTEIGRAPFPAGKASRPCEFIIMRRDLSESTEEHS